MRAKVKELFNALSSKEDKEYKSNLDNREVKKRKTKFFNGHKYPAGARIHIDFHQRKYIKKISDETYFIICPNNDMFFPVMWEELEIKFSNKDTRYCKQCDKDIYKVDNVYLYKQCKEEFLCMALSTNALEKLKKSMDKKEYDKLSNIIHISKLFFAYENSIYDRQENYYQEFYENNLTRELALQVIILDILNTVDIKLTTNFYMQSGIDLESILLQISVEMDYEAFKEKVKVKIEKLMQVDS